MIRFSANGLTITLSSSAISAANSFCCMSYNHIVRFSLTYVISRMNRSYTPEITIAYACCLGAIVAKYSNNSSMFISLTLGFKSTSSSCSVCTARRFSVIYLISVRISSIVRCLFQISISFASLTSLSPLGVLYSSIRMSPIICCSYFKTSCCLTSISVNRLTSFGAFPSIFNLFLYCLQPASIFSSYCSLTYNSTIVNSSAIFPYWIHSLLTTFLSTSWIVSILSYISCTCSSRYFLFAHYSISICAQNLIYVFSHFSFICPVTCLSTIPKCYPISILILFAICSVCFIILSSFPSFALFICIIFSSVASYINFTFCI